MGRAVAEFLTGIGRSNASRDTTRAVGSRQCKDISTTVNIPSETFVRTVREKKPTFAAATAWSCHSRKRSRPHSTTSTRQTSTTGGEAIDSRERWPNVITTVPECQYQSIYLHVKHATPCRATSYSGGFRPSTSRFVYCSITTSSPLCWIPHLTQYENPDQCRMRQLLSARTTTPPSCQAP